MKTNHLHQVEKPFWKWKEETIKTEGVVRDKYYYNTEYGRYCNKVRSSTSTGCDVIRKEKTMFRGKQDSKMCADQFGVGSTMKAGDQGPWLVVKISHIRIGLIHLPSMTLIEDDVVVEDVNFVSVEEARKLCNLANHNFTFTDFDMDSKGYKLL